MKLVALRDLRLFADVLLRIQVFCDMTPCRLAGGFRGAKERSAFICGDHTVHEDCFTLLR
jgi:hypothetical protein